MWNKSELKLEGVIYVMIRNSKNNKKYFIEFVVVKEELILFFGVNVS